MSATPGWVKRAMLPHAADSADVRWAVETAHAMWLRGDRDQALSWMHHAVQAATSDGQHERADELDRAGQELERLPAPAAKEPSIPADMAPTDRRPPGAMKIGKTAPYRVALDDITHLGGPNSDLLAACEPEGEASKTSPDAMQEATLPAEAPDLTTLPRKRSRPLPPAPSADVEATVVGAGMRRPQDKTVVMHAVDPQGNAGLSEARAGAPAPDPSAPPPPAQVKAPESAPASSLPKVLTSPPGESTAPMTGAPSTLGSPNAPLEPLRAVRVAVSAGTGKQLSVRLLDDGEALPQGAQEAFLLAVKKPG